VSARALRVGPHPRFWIRAGHLRETADQPEGSQVEDDFARRQTMTLVYDPAMRSIKKAPSPCAATRCLVSPSRTRVAVSAPRSKRSVRVTSVATLRAFSEGNLPRMEGQAVRVRRARAGAFLDRSAIAGSYTNVIGLPACEVVLDLRALGLIQQFP